MDVSVILVNYNTPDLTADAIAAARGAARQTACEFIVVDNSSDGSLRYRGEGRVFVTENKGFGNACNIGAREAVGRYLLFLNSDTALSEGALDRCLGYLAGEECVGVLGIRTLLPDGTLDKGCKRGFPTPAAAFYYFAGFEKRHPGSPKYGRYHMAHLSEAETNDVDCVSGAFMLMPRDVFFSAGGFDEAFFMYGEDIDLCYRVKQAGLRVVYFAGAAMTHYKGGSVTESNSPAAIRYFYDSMRLFYNKHYRARYGAVTNGAVSLGISLLSLLQTGRARGKRGRA